MKILIVDDDAMARRMAGFLLKRADCETDEADSGGRCLDILAEKPQEFGLILLDMLMPGMDGEHTLKRIRENEAAAKIPVILMSGNAESAESDCSRLSADGWVSKPFIPAELTAAVKNIIG
jgi:CheY-like chemotaxis protein